MAYRLKNGLFRVKCRHTGCTFDARFEIKQNIMGITEQDVETESKKIARDLAMIKHDAIHGRTHNLYSPLVSKVGGSYENVGAAKSDNTQDEAVVYDEYAKGDTILVKGERATTICEVLRGFAYPDINKKHRYLPGDSFGAAALLFDHKRTANIIAGEKDTRIAFYNIKELSRNDSQKARELYNKAMEDIFKVLADLEGLLKKTEKKMAKEESQRKELQKQVKALEKQLKEAKK